MRIVRVFAALALMTALAGCGSSGQLQLAGLNWGQDTPPPPPGSGDMTSSPASASTEITGSTPASLRPIPWPSTTRCWAAIRATTSCSASGTIARRTTVSPSSISAARSRRRRATAKPGSGLPPPTTGSSATTSPTAPIAQALAIFGPRPEVINNIGYSYLLRGDLRRARQKFAEAQAKDPGNPTIANNIALVDEAARRRKGLN